MPRSHRLGLLQHESSPDLPPPPSRRHARRGAGVGPRRTGDELSGRITRVPADLDSRCDLVMRPGEMSIHHPVILHGSNPNLSTEPRIGLSASYSAPEFYHGRRAAVCVARWRSGAGQRAHAPGQAPTETFERGSRCVHRQRPADIDCRRRQLNRGTIGGVWNTIVSADCEGLHCDAPSACPS